MITQISNAALLEQIAGGQTREQLRAERQANSDALFAAFRERAAAARARHEAREAREAAREPSSGSRRGFSPTATFGLP